jgi:hypothetical protein
MSSDSETKVQYFNDVIELQGSEEMPKQRLQGKCSCSQSQCACFKKSKYNYDHRVDTCACGTCFIARSSYSK